MLNPKDSENSCLRENSRNSTGSKKNLANGQKKKKTLRDNSTNSLTLRWERVTLPVGERTKLEDFFFYQN